VTAILTDIIYTALLLLCYTKSFWLKF